MLQQVRPRQHLGHTEWSVQAAAAILHASPGTLQASPAVLQESSASCCKPEASHSAREFGRPASEPCQLLQASPSSCCKHEARMRPGGTKLPRLWACPKKPSAVAVLVQRSLLAPDAVCCEPQPQCAPPSCFAGSC